MKNRRLCAKIFVCLFIVSALFVQPLFASSLETEPTEEEVVVYATSSPGGKVVLGIESEDGSVEPTVRPAARIAQQPSGAYIGEELTPQQQLAAIQKNGIHVQGETLSEIESKFMPQPVISPRTVTWIHLLGTYTCYAQQNAYYCVPATVQAVLRYMGGVVPSQGTIAKGLEYVAGQGSNFVLAAPYVNARQSRNTYINVKKGNFLESAYIGFLLTSVRASVPAMVRTGNASGGGHAMAVNACRSDKGSVQFADPWKQFAVPGANPFYQEAANTVFARLTHLAY